MSKVKELEMKVEKAEQKVEKGKATIVRHKKQLQKKLEKIANIGLNLSSIDLTDFSDYKWHDEYREYYWDFCDIENKQDDIVNATKKLKEAERVLNDWKDKLQKAQNEEDLIESEVPQVVKEYLNNWKGLAYEWHLKRYEEYNEYIEEHGLSYENLKERKRLFGNIIIEMYFQSDREKWLDVLLEKDKRNKILDLMARTKEVTGKIISANSLKIGINGGLNGIIEGKTGKVEIETIDAGGYNIQCYHYRVLVKKIS